MREFVKQFFSAKLSFVLTRLAVSLIALLTVVVSTLAWYTSNRTIENDGMTTSVDSPGNLVIAKTVADITAINTFTEAKSKVSFSDIDTVSLYAARHNPNIKVGDSCTPATNLYLQKLKSAAQIDFKTGLLKSGSTSTLTFEDLKITDTGYYKDYEVYIASTDEKLTTSGIKASISANSTERVHKARTVDFYCNGVFKGSLNVAQSQNGETVTIFTGDVPYNKDGNIYVLMRSYYDGGALDTSGKAYINTEYAYYEGASFSVVFEAEE